MLKKNIEWLIDGVEYMVRNVPYEEYDAEGEEFIDLDVAVKLEMIRDLMYEDKIPHVIDYSIAEGVEF